jgi:hypothetical protein
MQKYKSKFKDKKHLPQSTQRNNCVAKEKNTENTEKKINKNSVVFVVEKSGVERGGFCVFLFILIFNI